MVSPSSGCVDVPLAYDVVGIGPPGSAVAPSQAARRPIRQSLTSISSAASDHRARGAGPEPSTAGETLLPTLCTESPADSVHSVAGRVSSGLFSGAVCRSWWAGEWRQP